MWTYIRGGGGGRQTGGESEEDLDRNHPDIYNCTGQQPNCLTRSASLNAGVTLRLPGVGNVVADVFYFHFSVFDMESVLGSQTLCFKKGMPSPGRWERTLLVVLTDPVHAKSPISALFQTAIEILHNHKLAICSIWPSTTMSW